MKRSSVWTQRYPATIEMCLSQLPPCRTWRSTTVFLTSGRNFPSTCTCRWERL